jgi:hypothetical protein
VDQSTLVREQLDGGEKLIARLLANRSDIFSAGWVQTSEDGQPYLYIATRIADDRGLRTAYGVLADALQSLDDEWSHWMERIDDSTVKMLRTTEPLARGMTEVNQRYPGPFPTWFNGPNLGGVPIDGAYIYPPTLFQSQSQTQAG